MFLAAPDNAVFVLPAGQGEQGGSGFQIVHVLSTETAASTSPEFDGSQIDPAQLPAIGKYVLRPRAIESRIEISPRFGVWNDADAEGRAEERGRGGGLRGAAQDRPAVTHGRARPSCCSAPGDLVPAAALPLVCAASAVYTTSDAAALSRSCPGRSCC